MYTVPLADLRDILLYPLSRVHKNGKLEEERVTPIEAVVQSNLLNSTNNRTPGTCLATMAYVYKCAVCATIFSTVRPVSNFMELHTLPLAACSYALLPWCM